MGLLSLLLVLAIIGFIVWLITTYIPMPQPIRVAIIAVAAIAVILTILRAFGVSDIPLPHLK